jgi:hypothetical protein
LDYRHLLAQELAKYPTLDPQAIFAVAGQEGLGGGIGDGGHAYGPFQLNNAGGVITNMYGGHVNDPAVQNWAWSPAGLDFALNQIAKVAGGMKGQGAVSNIVSRFERPANIPGEIARAQAAYGGAPAQTAPPAGQTPAAPVQSTPSQVPAVPAMHAPALKAIVSYLLGK